MNIYHKGQQKVIVEVPAGHNAGASFVIDTGIPGKRHMKVVVPQGCGPGSKLQIIV